MHKNFCGWSLESVHEGTVDTKYTVEYINDSTIADELERTGDPALYRKREFNNADEAFAYYLRWYIDDTCIILNLWEQIYVNDKMVLEQRIEPAGYAKNVMREILNKEMKVRMENAEEKTERLKTSNELYKKFIDKFNAKEMFKEFTKQETEVN